MKIRASDVRVTQSHLRRMHPRAIEDLETIAQILRRAQRSSAVFRQGMNRKVLPEEARLTRVAADVLEFACRNFEDTEKHSEILLRFEVGTQAYFFSTRGVVRDGFLVAKVPSALYAMERRDRPRTSSADSHSRWRARIRSGSADVSGDVRDLGPGGVGVVIPADVALVPPLDVKITEGPRAGLEMPATVRHTSRIGERAQLAGLAFSRHENSLLRNVKRTSILPGSPIARSASAVRFAGSVVSAASSRAVRRVLGNSASAEIMPVRFENERGEQLAGLVDSWGEPERATAVVVPPAWGRTKETLLPLARTIVSTFRAAGQPVVVLRFDGTRRRGESYLDPDCLAAGREYHRFIFSQAVEDTLTAVDFVQREFAPASQVLITFSAASIDGRKAVVLDRGERIKGWLSVVGSADLQSLIRVISGGVDYVGGIERGLRFGIQPILGVEVDIDRAGLDALENGLAYLEDSRRDFEEIKVPVVWYHGRHDAWMDGSRVADVLSYGDTRNRVLVEVPTGHQLRSSSEAMKVFQAIAAEVAELCPGRRISPRVPKLADLELRQRAERGRLRPRNLDLKRFWHNYLVGSDETVGIDLMASTEAYRELMSSQVAAIGGGTKVLDLGCGVGNAIPYLAGGHDCRVVSLLDFVPEALARASRRAAAASLSARAVRQDLASGSRLPFRTASHDAVLASLVFSYVADPHTLLREIRRVLKPGGVLVASTLRPDADISQIYQDGLAELRNATDLQSRLGREGVDLQLAARNFLNEAAKLLEYEEEGAFRFWDEQAFSKMIRGGGFDDLRIWQAFGSPPQAIVATARRPR